MRPEAKYSPVSTARTDPDRSFEDRVILVTGSGRGIGKAIALHFAARGAHTAINYFRNRIPAEETAAQIRALGRKAIVVKANVGDPESVRRLFTELQTHFSRLDFLVNNAASGYNRPALEQKPKGWDWTMNINARAALLTAQHATPLMHAGGGGAIVNISSPGAHHVLPDYVATGASKAALEALTRYLAVELAEFGIRVNGVAPGLVNTAALRHFSAVRGDPDLLVKTIDKTPAARLVEPEDVAAAVAFLCSPASEMMRGQILVVDGGYTLLPP